MRVARRACSSEWARAKDIVEDASIQADVDAACHHALGARATSELIYHVMRWWWCDVSGMVVRSAQV